LSWRAPEVAPDLCHRDKSIRRANHNSEKQKLTFDLSSPFCKNILLFRNGKILYNGCHPDPTRGRFANVSNVGQVAVDVGGSFDDWSGLRTAKPWGPDTPTLVTSLRDAIPPSDGG
jgi:hypothetical protein